jgi:hypothetical protein
MLKYDGQSKLNLEVARGQPTDRTREIHRHVVLCTKKIKINVIASECKTEYRVQSVSVKVNLLRQVDDGASSRQRSGCRSCLCPPF